MLISPINFEPAQHVDFLTHVHACLHRDLDPLVNHQHGEDEKHRQQGLFLLLAHLVWYKGGGLEIRQPNRPWVLYKTAQVSISSR